MRKITLLDGGVGQEVYKRAGQPDSPMWSAQMILDQPGLVREVHRDFIQAGARVITINSYSCTPSRLRRDGKVEWFEKLQRQAYEIAASARDELAYGASGVRIAACLPPLIGSYTTDSRSLPELKSEYEKIVELHASRADLFLIETISNTREAKAAVEAALPAGKPVLLSFTVSESQTGQLRAGEPIEEAVSLLSDYALSGFLFNCSSPEAITEALNAVGNPSIPYGGYANGFTTVDPLRPGGLANRLSARLDLDEDTYRDIAMKWVEQGATLVGGCCEVGPAHIKRISDALNGKGYRVSAGFD